jgi:hypothetical protein
MSRKKEDKNLKTKWNNFTDIDKSIYINFILNINNCNII